MERFASQTVNNNEAFQASFANKLLAETIAGAAAGTCQVCLHLIAQGVILFIGSNHQSC
jgi:hypothetical protein